MDGKTKSNLLSGHQWLRLIYMLFYAVVLQVVGVVFWLVVSVQFLFALFTGEDSPQLRDFGNTLSRFVKQALMFLTYNTEDKPYPFADWPSLEEDVSASINRQS